MGIKGRAGGDFDIIDYVIKLHVSNLAEVERLEPQKQTYVVWMVTEKGVNENIGRINSSNNLNVSFETVSSYQPVQIFITAEVDDSSISW